MSIILDLETAGQGRYLSAAYDPAQNPPPANYKSEDAIEGHHKRAAAAWSAEQGKRCALSPRLGRIVAIGLKVDGEPAECRCSLYEPDEGELIRWAFETLGNPLINGPVVTFNGLFFDVPFLWFRAVATGVVIPVSAQAYLSKYERGAHLDLMDILLCHGRAQQGDGLKGFCESLGITPPTGDGAEVGNAVIRGDVDYIREHCLADVVATHALYQRVVAVGMHL